jgi:hypothetical protein
VIIELLGGELDLAKVQRLVPRGFDASDVKATLAALAFVLANAARHATPAPALDSELLQLGLPRENADGIARPYRANRDALVAAMRAQSLALPRLRAAPWRVDLVAGASQQAGVATAVVHFDWLLSHALDAPQPRLEAAAVHLAAGAGAAAPSESVGGLDAGRDAPAELVARLSAALAATRVPGLAANAGPDAAPRTPLVHLPMAMGVDAFLALHAELREAREAMRAVERLMV